MANEERKRQLEIASVKQNYAMLLLTIMTLMNILLGVFMVYRYIPIPIGMTISFVVMLLIAMKAHSSLLEDGETIWESPKDFHKRRQSRLNND